MRRRRLIYPSIMANRSLVPRQSAFGWKLIFTLVGPYLRLIREYLGIYDWLHIITNFMALWPTSRRVETSGSLQGFYVHIAGKLFMCGITKL